MKIFKKICMVLAVVLLLAGVGCDKFKPLQLKRSRIFLLGRILAGQTCDVRLLWRAGPNDPPPVAVTADLSQIGGNTAQALATDGTGIWRWTGQVTPAAFGEKTVRVTARDAADTAYISEKAVQVHDTTKAIAIASGARHGLALKADGTVVQWQKFDFTEAFYPPEGLTNVVSIDADGDHSLALKADGTVVSWGLQSDQDMIGDVPEGLSDVVAIAAGGFFNLALKADGKVVEWGGDTADLWFADNTSGLLDVPDDLSDVVAITAGMYRALALKADGTVISWGPDDADNAPVALEDVADVDAGGYSTLALKAEGTVLFVDNYFSIPRRAGEIKAKAIAAGTAHWMALRADGTVMMWWRTEYGRKVTYYVSDERLKNIIAIAEGGPSYWEYFENNSMALTKSGSVLAWKDYWYGQEELPVPEELQ